MSTTSNFDSGVAGKKIAMWMGIVGLASFIFGVVFLFVGNANRNYGLLYVSFALLPLGILLSILCLWAFIGIAIANLAAKKGRSWAAFFWLTILFSPIIMWIIAATISPLPGSEAYVAPQVGNSASQDSADQLQKLSKLHEDGVLTKAEFEAKKKELLDRI